MLQEQPPQREMYASGAVSLRRRGEDGVEPRLPPVAAPRRQARRDTLARQRAGEVNRLSLERADAVAMLPEPGRWLSSTGLHRRLYGLSALSDLVKCLGMGRRISRECR